MFGEKKWNFFTKLSPAVLHSDLQKTNSLGADLRSLRKARGWTLSDMAGALGRSVGWLSQVERDMSQPSIGDLRDMAAKLNVSVSLFFGQAETPAGETGLIVRKNARRPIGSNATEGLVEELLSPDLTDDFEVVHSTFRPNAKLTEFNQRPTQELGYVVSGRIDLWIDEDRFTLNAGDSFRLRGQPYRWANPYDVACVVIWVIAPPVY